MGAFADGSVLGLPRRASLLAGTGLASLFAAGLTVAARPAAAQLPTGGQVTAGSATINQTSSTRMDVTQSTSRAVIDWRSFSIGSGNSVNFLQPSSTSITLNRVNGADPSVIAGQLSANGRLVLINPNGIVFSQGSSVDTAGLVATTLGIGNSDFMAGRMTFSLAGRDGASVVNEGDITVRDGGLAALVAPEVRNSGTIRARMGRVVLAGAESMTLDPRGDGLISFEVARTGPERTTRAENTGRIEAQGGSVTISAASARGIVAGVVNVEGQVIATSVGQQNGVVSFGSGENGTTTVAGNVDVRGSGTGQTGGSVTVTGDRVRVASTARIDASGAAGGGSVRIGGDRQGQGTTQRARRTDVEQGAVIRADATDHGRGGTVIVWSDEYTHFMGSISATGGAAGGDGGFAEVSGKLWLGFSGTVDLRAPMGATGTLLLDPTDITVSVSANRDISATSPFQFADDPPPGGTNGTSNLSVATLQAALAGADVTISTAAGTGAPDGGRITIADAVAWSSGRTLTLNATTGIVVNAAVTGTADGTAGGALNGALTMSVSGIGGITQGAAGIITVQTLSASTTNGAVALATVSNRIGSVSGTAAGGTNGFAFANSAGFQVGNITAAGAAQLTADTGNITQSGGITATALTATATAGNIDLSPVANSVGAITLTAGPAGTAQFQSSGALVVNGATAAGGVVLTAGAGDITQGAGAANAITTASLTANATAGSVTLTNTANAIQAVAGQAGTNFVVGTTTALSAGPIVAGNGARVELIAGSGQTLTIDGAISVAGGTLALAADTLAIGAGAPAGNVLAGGLPNQLEFRTATAGRTIVAGTNAGADPDAAASLVLVLGGGGQFDRLVPVTGGRWRVGAATTTGLEVASGAITMTGFNVGLGDTGGTVILESGAGGTAIRQTGAIDAVRLRVLAPNGTVLLDNPANTILAGNGAGGLDLHGGFLSGSSGGNFTFVSDNAFQIGDPAFSGGISAPGQAVVLSAASSGVFQRATGAGIQAATLTVDATNVASAQVLLDGAGNAVGTVSGSVAVAPGAIFRVDADGNVTASNITATGRTIDIRSANGTVTAGNGLAGALLHMEGQTGVAQSAPIAVTAVTALSAGGSVNLADAANSFTAIEGGTGTAIGGTGNGNFTVASTGVLTVGGAEASVNGIQSAGDLVVRGGSVTVAEQARAGNAATLQLQTSAGGTLTVNGALAAPGGNAVFVADTLVGAGGFATADRPDSSVIRTATANRTIGIAGAAGQLQVTAGQAANLAAAAGGTLRVGSVNRAGENAAGAITVGTIDLSGLTLALESAAAGSAISQTGAITAAGLAAVAPNGSLDLNLTNSVGTIHAETNSSFIFQNAGSFQVLGIDATSVALTALSGNITQGTGAANAITTGNLSANAVAGGVTLDNAANAATTLQVGNAGGGSFAFTNGTALTVNDVTATGDVAIIAGGDLTLGAFAQITAGNGQRLQLQAGGANAQLNIGFFSQLTVDSGTAVFVADRVSSSGFGSLFTGGITASEIRTATAGRGIALGSGNTATQLVLDSTALARLAPVSGGGRLRIGATGQVVGETPTGAVEVNSSINLAGGTVQLESGAAGTAISQTASISTTNLVLLAPNGSVAMTNGFNDVSTLAGSAGGSFSYRQADSFQVAGISAPGAALTLRSDVGITQAGGAGGAIVAQSLDATVTGGAASFDNAANQVAVVSGNADGGFTYAGTGNLSIAGITTNAAAGTVTLNTTGGDISQTGSIVARTLSVTAQGNVALDGAVNDTAVVNAAVSGAGNDFRFTADQSFQVGAAGISAPGDVALRSTGGSITQAGAIQADALTVNANGTVTLTGAGNEVASIAGSAPGGFSYTDATGFQVDGIGIATNGVLALTATSGAITQGAGAGAAISALTLIANATGAGGAVTMENGQNTVTFLAGNSAGDFRFRADSGITLGTLSASGTALLRADAGNIGQLGTVTASVLDVTAAAGSVVLGSNANSVGTLRGGAQSGFTFGNAGGFVVDGLVVNAGNAQLSATTGTISQTGAISATALTVTATGGSVALTDATNQVATVGGSAGADFAFTDADGFAVSGIGAGGSVTLRATTGAITQTGAITATVLDVAATGAGGSVALNNGGNANGTVIGNATGDFAYTAANGFVAGDIAAGPAGTITLGATNGSITQSGALSARELVANANGVGGAVTLTDAANSFQVVGGSASGGFAYGGSNGFTVSSIAAGGAVALTAANGAIGQTGAIAGTSLSATATGAGGAVTLTNAGNEVATLGGAATGAFAYADATGFTVSGIAAGGAASLVATTGTIGQTGAITADALSVTANGVGGGVVLANPGNDVASLAGASSGDFSYADATGFAVAGVSAAGTATLSAAGAITQTAALSANTLAVNGASVALTDAGNDVANLGGGAGGNFAFTDQNGFTVTGLAVGGTATLVATTGAIGQTGAITAAALQATADGAGGAVTLTNALNNAGSVGGGAAGGFAYADADGFAVTGIDAGGAVALSAATGAITQTGAISGASLVATANGAGGSVALADTANAVASVGGGAVGDFAFGNANGFDVTGIAAGGGVTLVAASGVITQSAAITGTALSATANGAGGAVTLTNAGNDAASIAGGATGDFAYTDANGFAVAGVAAGGTATFAAIAGAITQTGAITADTLLASANGAGGSVTLTDAGNDVANLGGGAAGDFTYGDATALNVTGLSVGGTATLSTANGGITQSGAIVANALVATAGGAGSAVALANAGNDADSVGGGAGGAFAFTDQDGFAVSGIAAGAGVTLVASTGAITQTGAITGTALDVTATGAGGLVTLANAGNDVASVDGQSRGSFAYRDATDLSVGQVASTAGDVSLRAGGNLVVAGDVQAAQVARLQAGGDLTQANASTIQADQLLAVAGGRVDLTGETSNTVDTFAARGTEVSYRNQGSLTIGSVAGDATVNDGLTQAGIAADPGPVRIFVVPSGGAPDLVVDQPIQSQRILLSLAGSGHLRLGNSTLAGVGGGSPALVVLDATDGAVPDNLNAVPTFAGFSGGAPNTAGLLGGLTVGSTVGAQLELGQQTIPGTSMVVLVNGTTVTSTGSGLTLRGLAFITRVGATNNRVNINGTINGQSGANAASVTGLSINPTDTIKLNNCPVATVSCIVLPTTLPGIPPLGDNLAVGALAPAIDPSTLTFINVGAEDSDEDEDNRRRVPVGRPAAAQEARP